MPVQQTRKFFPQTCSDLYSFEINGLSSAGISLHVPGFYRGSITGNIFPVKALHAFTLFKDIK